ncbi:MAG: hypothetical protein QOH86_530 [Sphingomonadales bacterium]|nr:hypothetical protein [Sphingomonadales bacterium]
MQSKDLKALQRALAASGNEWIAGATPFSAMSADEFRFRLGAEPPGGEAALYQREQGAKARLLEAVAAADEAGAPPAWDWRSTNGSNYLGDLRDQKNCGSCVAFGAIAAIEGTTRVTERKPDLRIDLAEAHLFYCHAAAEGRNCGNGWWPDAALNAARSKGIVDEACFPYTPGDQACRLCSDATSRTVKIKAWSSLGTIAEMKTWLSTRGPLIGCFAVYDDFRAYKSGVYRHLSGALLGGHCICVVGYSDSDGAWIIRNSWGPDWAEQGYGRIAYGEVGLDHEMWAVETLSQTDVVVTPTKLENALISGLWTNAQAPLAQAFIAGTGWRKLASPNLVTLAAAARVARARCTIGLSGDTIVEIYVF